mmetsp:Transcript_17772/g.12707  ORF Transcript_17772/g.12707 Transcript_17772/m.12707 type:complete len:201 (+) Transcript_17772:326-928(+)
MTHPILCVGTDKGSLVFYNRKTQRRVPCISKHGKKVTFGDWHRDGILITCSEDKLLTVSNHQGDTIQDSIVVKGEPAQIKWSLSPDPNKKVFCCILQSKSIVVFDAPTQKNFIINFNPQYGKVSCFQWYGEENVIVGFSSGIVAQISVKDSSMGQELFAVNAGFNSQIDAINVNHDLGKVSVASLGTVRIYSLADWTEQT